MSYGEDSGHGSATGGDRGGGGGDRGGDRGVGDRDRGSDRRSAPGGGGGGDRGDRGDRGGSASVKYDEPPNSRLFIVCGKQITESEFRSSFGVFGTIEEVWMVKDRITGDPKGVTYIKFSKTSEAALAMEEMNGRCIAGSPRPLKVLIAHSRDQGSRRDMNEEERLLRLFVVVPKTMTESELREHFETFGDIDYVSIVRDRNTKESKGFAYVKYHRMSHSAKAFEMADKSFKAVFADPKPTKEDQQAHHHHHHHHGDNRSGRNNGGPGSTTSGSSMGYNDLMSYMDTSQSNPDGIIRLSVITSNTINQDQLWRLFDLVPGLDYCDRGRGGKHKYFTVVYNNPQSATYAKEKLHGFEYPPGHRLVVKYDVESNNYNSRSSSGGGGGGGGANNSGFQQPRAPPPTQLSNIGRNNGNNGPNIQNDLAHLTETIANATALLQAAGYNAPNNSSGAPPSSSNFSSNVSSGETYDPSYCSVKLPSPQPLAAMDSPVAERLFIVCTPTPPHLYALKDIFGRFGSLIDIYMLNGKTCGYAKYSSKESADRAVTALHGQEICGSRLKVMPADPQDKSGDHNRKRQKIADDGDQ